VENAKGTGGLPDAATAVGQKAPHNRRYNYVQAAYVDAALSIRDSHGLRKAEHILSKEGVPGEVIDRILFTSGPQRRKYP
jgi:hypothetical protein